MSAFNDPRYLAATGAIKGLPTIIGHDRPCPGCGYNLIGLAVGGVCPECGRPITSVVRKGLDDTLIDAPRPYLKRFASALTAGFIGLALNVLGLFTALSLAVVNSVFGFYGTVGPNGAVGPQLRIPTPSDGLFAAAFVLGSALWLAGLIVATLPRPTPPSAPESREREWSRMRVAAWLTQGAWPFASIVILILALAAPAPAPGGSMPAWVAALATLALAATLVAIGGLVPAAILLARYADWIPDTDLGWRMRTSAWSIGVFGSLILLTGVTPPGLPSFAGLIPFVLWMSLGFLWLFFLAGLAVLFWSIAQMAKTAWDAVANHAQREERDKRMLERMRQEREDQQRRADLVPHLDEPAPGVRKVGVAPRRPTPGA